MKLNKLIIIFKEKNIFSYQFSKFRVQTIKQNEKVKYIHWIFEIEK